MEIDKEFEKSPTIIIDNGSCFIKSGLSTQETPRAHFRTCIGYPKNKDIYIKDYYIGREIKGQMNALDIKYPIKQGVIENWDELEKIWKFIFEKELEVDPSGQNIILTQPLMNKKEDKEKMAQLIFETLISQVCIWLIQLIYPFIHLDILQDFVSI